MTERYDMQRWVLVEQRVVFIFIWLAQLSDSPATNPFRIHFLFLFFEFKITYDNIKRKFDETETIMLIDTHFSQKFSSLDGSVSFARQVV